MDSAAKFIDFFIHDILDYTVLFKNEKGFSKNMEVFNIKEAIQEILDIMEDKIKMKQLKVIVNYVGFDSQYDYNIKTD